MPVKQAFYYLLLKGLLKSFNPRKPLYCQIEDYHRGLSQNADKNNPRTIHPWFDFAILGKKPLQNEYTSNKAEITDIINFF
jgi:hypothetical protein